MPEETAIDDDQARERNHGPKSRRSGGFPSVTFGLGAAALAGIVVAVSPAAASAASAASADSVTTTAVTTAPITAAAGPGEAINQLTRMTTITCSVSGSGPGK
jgi:hypothetical protein